MQIVHSYRQVGCVTSRLCWLQRSSFADLWILKLWSPVSVRAAPTSSPEHHCTQRSSRKQSENKTPSAWRPKREIHLAVMADPCTRYEERASGTQKRALFTEGKRRRREGKGGRDHRDAFRDDGNKQWLITAATDPKTPELRAAVSSSWRPRYQEDSLGGSTSSGLGLQHWEKKAAEKCVGVWNGLRG